MKLLFDQNISFRILKLLPENFLNSKQVRSVGLEGKKDIEIWQFALENKYAIVSFDADFADIAYLRGFPPKIIWLRTGNLTTNKVAEKLIHNQQIIKEFLTANEFKDIACLEIE